MPTELEIAPASYEDLVEVARIHVASWKQTYVSQVPQAHLNGLDAESRLRLWEEQFPKVSSGLFVARVNDVAVGFICFGRGRDEDRRDWGEIYAIYVLAEQWGGGVGYRLYQRASEEFQRDGLGNAYLWVLDTNRRAIAAYERWGGAVEHGREKDDVIGGKAVREVAVLFTR